MLLQGDWRRQIREVESFFGSDTDQDMVTRLLIDRGFAQAAPSTMASSTTSSSTKQRSKTPNANNTTNNNRKTTGTTNQAQLSSTYKSSTNTIGSKENVIPHFQLPLRSSTASTHPVPSPQEVEDERECSFAPKLPVKSVAMARRSRSKSPLHRDERLYREREQLEERRRALQREVEAQEQALCPFTPQLLPPAAPFAVPPNTPPLYERVVDAQKEHIEVIRKLAWQVEAKRNEELTFTPQINASLHPAPRSHITVNCNNNESDLGSYDDNDLNSDGGSLEEAGLLLCGDAATRLTRYGNAMVRRRQQLRNEILEAEFKQRQQQQPRLSKGTQALVQKSPLLQAPFQDRLIRYEATTANRQQERRRRWSKETGAEFQPTIAATHTSHAILRQRRPELLHQSMKERVQRLYEGGGGGVVDNNSNNRDEEGEEMLFQPTINDVSRLLGRPSSLEELYRNERGQRQREKLANKIREEEMAECTFQPKMVSKLDVSPTSSSSPSRRLSGDWSNSGDWYRCPIDSVNNSTSCVSVSNESTRLCRRSIDFKNPEAMLLQQRQIQEAKQRRIEGEALLRDLESRAQCSFKPRVKPPPVESTRPVVVRGLSRFLELQSMSVQRRLEAEQREREVFRVQDVDRFRDPVLGTTIAEPFSFTQQQRRSQSRSSRAVRETLEQAESELTFEPRPVYSFSDVIPFPHCRKHEHDNSFTSHK